MKLLNRWTAAALALALTLSVSIPSALALPAGEPFADFRIDAVQIDAPERTLSIDWYRQNESGAYLPADVAADYDYTLNCKVNRVTGDATFYIQPNAEGVWVTLDYLTDVNGDGMYELLDGALPPAWDSLDVQGRLVQGGNEALTAGQTYILSAEALVSRYTAAAQARVEALDGFSQSSPVLNRFPLCQVTLHCMDSADGQEYTQVYYLEIFEDMLLPGDVLPGASWYEAVVYCLARGWLTGRAEEGIFSPYDPLTRAQLAQVLWTMSGCPAAEGTQFADVAPEDWFCQAVAWCWQEGLIAGYDDGTFLPDAPLTREQLAAFLCRYSRPAASALHTPASLSQYEDCALVSSWAYESMSWAVASQLFDVSDRKLHPGDTVTRGELAEALYAYHSAQAPLSLW